MGSIVNGIERVHAHRGHRRPVLAIAALVLLATGTAACSGDEEPAGIPTVSGSPTASQDATPGAGETPYLDVPTGVELTGQGSALSTGDQAVVAWEPKQGLIGVLDVTVDSLESTTLKKSFSGWKLPENLKTASPYFVRVTVENAGDTELGGRTIPLYAVDGDDTLVEASSFVTTYPACPSTPLPKKFAPGDRAKACLVYLLPDAGDLQAVSFRPTQDFNPITWSGDVVPYEPAKTDKGSKGSQGEGSKKNGKKSGS
ncbi:hypothetical protein GCM10022215_12510 [Nocardioides fonticola]|uniref:DUF4352 domain-containing protein n=1 Tax=Nocardioides fonticola TaxID=450363 RepID=A0ABP7XF81_9ACTN